MSWQERLSSKMNRSSWKTAHNDYHPQVDDEEDLLAHLTTHHPNKFIGDMEDHELYHTDPDGYNAFYKGLGFPVKNDQPDHYHSNDHKYVDIPDSLPETFASKIAHEGEESEHGRGEGQHRHLSRGFSDEATHPLSHMERISDRLNGGTCWEVGHPGCRKCMHVMYERNEREGSIHYADPTTTLRAEGILGMIDPDEEVVGPQDLDSNATEVDKFPKAVGVFKNSGWKIADSESSPSEFGNPIDYNENRMQSLEAPGLEIKTPLDTGKRNYTEQRQDANPLTLRSWYTGDDVNGPWPHTKNLSGPLDFEPTDDQTKDSTGPIMGSFNSRNAHFNDVVHPFPTEDDIYDHLVTHHFGESPIGDDYLKQTLRERLPLFNNQLIGEHLTFHFDDTRIENPLVGRTSWVQYHEHDDNPKINIPNDVSKLKSYSSKYAHDDYHPWPNINDEAIEHLVSGHHENLIQWVMKERGHTRDQVVSSLRHHQVFSRNNGQTRISALDGHVRLHKDSNLRSKYPLAHEHDEDFEELNVPDNIETIAPTYITSSWHQSNAEIFDTNPDEETPDSLLNPADEPKNGRPRSTDLPSQNAQFIPGMLVDHDPMGGSDFGST